MPLYSIPDMKIIKKIPHERDNITIIKRIPKEKLELIIKELNHKIDEVSIEDMFYAFNPKTVIKLAQFRGAISLKILQNFGNFSEYTPLQVKQAVTGNGKATKEQVSFMVKRLLGIKKEIKPLDITDAIAIALTHSQRIKG